MKSFIYILTALPLSLNPKVIYLTFVVLLLWYEVNTILPTPPPNIPYHPLPSSSYFSVKNCNHTNQTNLCSMRRRSNRNSADSQQKFLRNYVTSFGACRERERSVCGIFSSRGWKLLVFFGRLMHMITSLGFLATCTCF